MYRILAGILTCPEESYLQSPASGQQDFSFTTLNIFLLSEQHCGPDTFTVQGSTGPYCTRNSNMVNGQIITEVHLTC